MPEFHLTTSLNILFVMLGCGAAMGISFFVYRFTLPPIPLGLKIVLMSLRSLALFLILLLISEPLLSLLRRTEEPPVVTVLLDNSKSMTIKDNKGDRKAVLLSTLQTPSFRNLSSLGAVHYGVFDSRMRPLSRFSSDSLTFDGEGTDMSGALRRLKENAAKVNVQAIILLTDGNSTTGSSPLYEAEEIGIPIFAIGIGDTSEHRDALIRKVITNAITYAGNRVPVNVTLKSSGFTNERVEVFLREGTSVLDRRIISLQPGTREYAVALAFIPGNEGMHKLSVEVSGLPDEVSYQNNRTTFFTKVLKSKLNVLFVAGAPSPDVSFIRRSLESDQTLKLNVFIEQKDGQFGEGPLTPAVLREADCLVLVGYPGANSSTADLSAIAGALDSGTGGFIFLSRTVDPGKLRNLEHTLPFNVQRQPAVAIGGSTDEQQVFISIRDEQRANPIVKISSASSGIDVWSQLPPLFISGSNRAKPEAEVLGRVRIQSITMAEPLLLGRNVNRRKSLALLGYGVWRWKLMPTGTQGSETMLDEFLSNGIRWLTTREDERPIRIQPTREIFTGQEPVEFTGQVYDESFRPVDEADVLVTVTGGGQTNQVTLTPLGNGRYEGSLDPMEEGDYTFSASVRADGRQMGDDRGLFSIGGLNVEFQETRMNKLLLQQLAARTGGKYYDAENVGDLARDLLALPNLRGREVVHSSEIELWNKSWMLAAIVLLFAVEWFLRKRNGML